MDGQEQNIEARDDEQQEESVNIKKWCDRIEASEKYMKQNLKPRLDLARARYRAEHLRELRGRTPTHNQVNLVYAIGNNLINSVYFRNPEFNLSTRRDAKDDPEYAERVENTEQKLNDFLRDNNDVKKKIRRCLWNAYLGGFGAIFSDFEYRDMPDEEALQANVASAMQMGYEEADAIEQAMAMTPRTILKNTIVVQRIRPEHLLFPKNIDFDEYKDSPWLGFSCPMTLEEVKNNPDFDQEVTQKLKGDLYENIVDREYTRNENNKEDNVGNSDIKYVMVRYIFIKPEVDGMPFKLLVIADEDKMKPLQYTDYEKGHDGYPIKLVNFNAPDDDNFYPSGDPWIWESQLVMVDEFWARLLKHIRKSNSKVLLDRGVFGVKEAKKMKSNKDMDFVQVDLKGRVFEQAYHVYQNPPIERDQYEAYNLAKMLLDEIGPRSGMARGRSNSDTATEANIIQQNEMIDIDARMDDVRAFIIELGRDWAGLLANNFQGEDVIRIEKDDGQVQTREITKDELTADIDADVDVESMQSQRKDVMRRHVIDTLQTLAVFEPLLAKTGKAVDGEFFIRKLMENVAIRNAEKGIVDLNIRNPNKEHEDYVFGGKNPIPMRVQDGEDLEKHLEEHTLLRNDELALAVYEQLQPSFTEMLDQHIIETQQALSKKRGIKPQQAKPIDGTRPQQATEEQRI